MVRIASRLGYFPDAGCEGETAPARTSESAFAMRYVAPAIMSRPRPRPTDTSLNPPVKPTMEASVITVPRKPSR